MSIKLKKVVFFTRKYKCFYLVYYEEFESIESSIDQEKQIKKGTRTKKVELIASINPNCVDLSADWYE